MSYKLKFDQEAGTCTRIIMYPSDSAEALLQHLRSKGFQCSMNFRGEEEGCTIVLENANWNETVRAFEEFVGRTVLTSRFGASPPRSLHVSGSSGN